MRVAHTHTFIQLTWASVSVVFCYAMRYGRMNILVCLLLHSVLFGWKKSARRIHTRWIFLISLSLCALFEYLVDLGIACYAYYAIIYYIQIYIEPMARISFKAEQKHTYPSYGAAASNRDTQINIAHLVTWNMRCPYIFCVSARVTVFCFHILR